MYPKDKLYSEQVKVTQHDIDKALKLQEQSAIQRHEVLDQEKLYTERQRSYLRVLELRKQLRLAEEQFQQLYKKPVGQELPKKKEKSMILKNGEWVELQ